MINNISWRGIRDIGVKEFVYGRKLTENILMVITDIVQNVSLILQQKTYSVVVVVLHFEGRQDNAS